MNLKELIKLKGYSTYSLAEKMGKSHTTIYRWCKKINQPNCEEIVQLANILKVQISKIVLIFANKEEEK